ncbi:MAG TPA: hypothetical protein VMJ32_03945 [Pirellulales bacterium]|nr:hypothetical protein [Pirellulales bacterium]
MPKSFQKTTDKNLLQPIASCLISQGRAAGGFSPVCLTSFSVVIVVFPPGVVISVSVFVDDLSLQPAAHAKNKLEIKTVQTNRFMGYVSNFKILDKFRQFLRETGVGPPNHFSSK